MMYVAGVKGALYLSPHGFQAIRVNEGTQGGEGVNFPSPITSISYFSRLMSVPTPPPPQQWTKLKQLYQLHPRGQPTNFNLMGLSILRYHYQLINCFAHQRPSLPTLEILGRAIVTNIHSVKASAHLQTIKPFFNK